MNKKNQIKPALIVCAVMALLIVVAFVITSLINRNVVKNTKGTMIYVVEASGKQELMTYDFREKKESSTGIKADSIKDACYCDGSIAFIADNKVGLYNTEANSTEYFTMEEEAEYISIDFEDNTLCLGYRIGSKYLVDIIELKNGIISGENLGEIAGKLKGICIYDNSVFYVADNSKESVFGEITFNTKTQNSILKTNDGKFTDLSIKSRNMFLVEQKNSDLVVVSYDFNKKKVSDEKTQESDKKINTVAAVYSRKYLAASEDGIYVCNGSNMQKVELSNLSKLKVLDYME